MRVKLKYLNNPLLYVCHLCHRRGATSLAVWEEDYTTFTTTREIKVCHLCIPALMHKAFACGMVWGETTEIVEAKIDEIPAPVRYSTYAATHIPGYVPHLTYSLKEKIYE